ncbi:unnamed protein product [Calicophoron daubneyi]|uniref:Zinc transporter 2 n=1 Tax=Calicophoron daubneyi TaxID=300641 RepID=A0AAV2TIB3_CALDB
MAAEEDRIAATTDDFTVLINNGCLKAFRFMNQRNVRGQNSAHLSITVYISAIERPQLLISRHCHDSMQVNEVDRRARNKLIIAIFLCLFFMTAEVVGGSLARSLAIMTDAAHLLTDFATFIVNLVALFVAARPRTKRLSFGWYRTEIVGALISVLMIWAVTGVLVYLAIQRIIYSLYDVDGKIMLISSAIGVGVNLTMLLMLNSDRLHCSRCHKQYNAVVITPKDDEPQKDTKDAREKSISKENNLLVKPNYENTTNKPQNIVVRAAFVHVIGDLTQSLGVFTAAMIIYFKPTLQIVDPICTFLFSLMVLITTTSILRDALSVIMESTPRHIKFAEVKDALQRIPGVRSVHDLHIWSLTLNKIAASAHLAVESCKESAEILQQANDLLRKQYGVHDLTVQIEEQISEMKDCPNCLNP